MSWPFSSVGAPNLDTGPGMAVPDVPTAIAVGSVWILGADFLNGSAEDRTVTLTDTAGNIVDEITLPAGAPQPYEWPFRPCDGLKWFTDGDLVTGHIWGYQ